MQENVLQSCSERKEWTWYEANKKKESSRDCLNVGTCMANENASYDWNDKAIGFCKEHSSLIA